jgi:hypothetical protein
MGPIRSAASKKEEGRIGLRNMPFKKSMQILLVLTKHMLNVMPDKVRSSGTKYTRSQQLHELHIIRQRLQVGLYADSRERARD